MVLGANPNQPTNQLSICTKMAHRKKTGSDAHGNNHDIAPGLATINNVRWHIVNVETMLVGPRDTDVPMHQ